MKTQQVRFAAAWLAAALVSGASADAWSQEADPHAHHHHAAARATRTTADYQVPAVKLVRDDGKAVSLADELSDGAPVALNFIFTTCPSICPVMSGTFAQLEKKLPAQKVHLISISIDPEQDTPARLRQYAQGFKAGPEWRFYTGTVEASLAVQRAFGAYRGDKMSHSPATFLRTAHGKGWVRLEGFASAEELAKELREPGAAASAAR